MRRSDTAIPRAVGRSSRALNHLNEDRLIEAIRDLVESPAQRRVLNGIGDDAAVWQPSRSHRSVITTDVLVENVHFRRSTMSLHDAGWRSMASNLSDIAAMGARPVLATVALGIPEGSQLEDILELYRGMNAVATRFNCAIAGGDITRNPALMLSITVVGEVRPSNVKTRSGGLPGDVVAVTGKLGASRAGLHLADNENMLGGELRDEALAAHRRPVPRVEEGAWLGASAHVHAMMDVSDGLSTDLGRLCARSRCAAVVEEVPVAASAAQAAKSRGEDPRSYALTGGEDFELLVAVNARAFRYLSQRFAKRFGRPLLAVGHMRAGSGTFMREDGREAPLAATGYDHVAGLLETKP